MSKICKHCKSEIENGAKICPNCRKKQGMPVWLIVILVIVGISMIGSFSSSETNSGDEKTGTTKNKTNKTSEKFTLLDGHSGFAGDYDIGYYVEGYVQNNTDKEYSYVSIEFNLYDSEGAIIGTATDSVSNLESNGKWKFKALSLTTSEETTSIASYKLKEITGW